MSAERTVRLFAVFGAVATVLLAVYSAQPWGDNYAYQDIFGYLMLAAFMGWAISPYVYLFLSTRFFPVSGSRPGLHTGLRVGTALLITVVGIAAAFDAVIVHPDAQGGLIFLFLPVYQWAAIGVTELTRLLVRA